MFSYIGSILYEDCRPNQQDNDKQVGVALFDIQLAFRKDLMVSDRDLHIDGLDKPDYRGSRNHVDIHLLGLEKNIWALGLKSFTKYQRWNYLVCIPCKGLRMFLLDTYKWLYGFEPDIELRMNKGFQKSKDWHILCDDKLGCLDTHCWSHIQVEQEQLIKKYKYA